MSAQRFWFSCVCCSILAIAQIASGQEPNYEYAEPQANAVRHQFGSTRFLAPRPVFDMALSPDGKFIVTRDSEHVLCWDSNSGKVLWTREVDSQQSPSYGHRSFAFPRSRDFFYSQSGPEKLTKFNVVTGETVIRTLTHTLPLRPENRPINSFPGATLAVDVPFDGSRIAVAGSHGIVICDEAGNSLLEIPNKPKLAIAPTDWKQDEMLFNGHYSMAIFAPDGKSLAVLTSDAPNRVRILDSTNAQELSAFELESRVVRMAIAPDGSSIATTERNGAVSQFSIATGQRVWQQWQHRLEQVFTPEPNASAIAYSPDGTLVAAAVCKNGRELIMLFDAISGTVKAELVGHQLKPWSLVFTADSKTLVSAGLDRLIRKWDVQSAALPQQDGFTSLGSVASVPQGTRLAIPGVDGNIRLFETGKSGPTGRAERIIETGNSVISSIALSRDGKQVASGFRIRDELIVCIWNTSSGEVVYRWSWPNQIAQDVSQKTARIGTLEFSPDGTRLAATANGQGRAYLLDVTSGKQVAELPHELLCSLSFDRTGKQLVTGGANERLLFWDATDGKLLREEELFGGELQNLKFSPVDDIIVTAHFPNVLRTWNSIDLTLRKRTPLSGEANFEALAFSPNGKWLVTGSSGNVNILDARTAELLYRPGSHKGRVLSVGFAEQGRVLLSGGSDSLVYCWELTPSDTPNFDKLWSDLRHRVNSFTQQDREIESAKLFWELIQIGDPAVDEIERRLQPIKTVVNLIAITRGVDPETAETRIRLAQQLSEKDSTVELDARISNVMTFLKLVNSPKSIELLKRLADTHSAKAIRQAAAAAIKELK